MPALIQQPRPAATRFAPLADHPLAWLLLAVVACWLPYFSSAAVPFHDSAFVYQSFQYFYSQLFFDGELVQWLPYGNYGVPAALLQWAVQPTAYAVGLLGLLLHVKNTLLLLKLALLLDELVYAFGLYVLGGMLYARRTTQLLIAAAGFLSVSWLQQLYLNLSVFYLLPLVLVFMIRFFQTGSVRNLFIAGCIEVCSLVGGVPYFAPLHLLVLLVFAAPLCFHYPRALRAFIAPRGLLTPSFGLLIIVTALVGSFLAGSLDGVALLSRERDPKTGEVLLKTFLNYGRMPLATTLFSLVTGGMPHGDNTYYVGLVPIAMFVYALFVEKCPTFIGLAIGFVMMLWLSIGGWFSTAVYYFPGMSMFRHIGLVFGLASPLLLLASGFGLDRLLRGLTDSPPPPQPWQTGRVAVLSLIVGLMTADLCVNQRPNETTLVFVTANWKPFFAFRVAVCCFSAALLVALFARRRKWKGFGLASTAVIAACLLLDVGSFRAEVFCTMPAVDPGLIGPRVFEADRLPYLEQRSNEPESALAQDRIRLFTWPFSPTHRGRYLILYGFARFDPCEPKFRTDIYSSAVLEMLERRGGRPREHIFPSDDAAFQRSLGCQAPKLRLTRRVIVAATENDARRTFARLADPQSTVVLTSDHPNDSARVGPIDREDGDTSTVGHVHVDQFSSNGIRISATVDGANPAWLVYADSWHPAWQARIDGQKVPVLRANLGFKAVRVASGTHDIEFAFVPQRSIVLSWALAIIGTIFGSILCAALALAVIREFRPSALSDD